jgi:hypothetical protein
VNARILGALASIAFACVYFSGTPGICADKPPVLKLPSPLNEQNLATILDNQGRFTDADLQKLLGPPNSIVVDGQIAGWERMNWEDVTRIEVKCRKGVVESISGAFSPRLPSRIINYSTFKQLRIGMTADDVIGEFFIGWPPRIVKDSTEGTATLVFEQYNRFHVALRDGKVKTATRVWHTDEHLNTIPK